MATTGAKRQILADAGYAYSFDRLSYINRDKHKIFSIEFVQDHDEDTLRASINEEIPGDEWRFYFNTPPSEAVKQEFLATSRL